MPRTLPIRINNDGLHDIHVERSFETHEPFAIVLENDGAPVHVHVHLDDDLSELASIEATNHYVEAGSVRRIPVAVHDGPGRGRLKVVTGYGAETAYVDVSVVEPPIDHGSIPVDESLGKPNRRPTRSQSEPSELWETLPLAALGVLALALVVGATFLVDGVVALFGAVVVLVGIAVAVYFLLR